MKSAFVSWQNPDTRIWHIVGLLKHADDYSFRYTRGAEEASKLGFEPFVAFPELREVYTSSEVFPFFANRIMTAERPEYAGYLERLALTTEEASPMEVLIRSSGTKATDHLEIIGEPVRTDDNQFQVDFVVRSIRHLPVPMHDAVLRLEPGDSLFLMPDPQNHMDSKAVGIRTERIQGKQETYLIGYVPGCYTLDFRRLLDRDPSAVSVKVLKVNPPPAPSQHRLLCRFTSPWPDDFVPFQDEKYMPIIYRECETY